MKKQSNKYNTFIISLSLVGSMVLLGLGADVFSVSWRQLIKPVSVKEVKKAGVDFILVDDFEKGQSSGVFYERKNSIGGYQGTWAKRPSYSIITKLSDERASARGRYLAIEYKKEAGWAGWYTLLNNADISNYNALTFWVKGDKGGEKFDIGLADAKMQEFQMDAVYAGPIDLFLPLGVTTEWQKVKIPVSRVESQIDVNKMGSIVLWFKYGGEGKVYIDDMEFESDKEVQKKEAFNSPKANFDPKHPRSLWVWKVDPVTNQKGRKELLQLCKDAAITNMYLYFGDFDPEKEPEYASGLADFLKEAHKLGIKVEALTGNPVWALKVYHQSCLDWIDAFLKFNKTRPQNERIDGVSLDVEPYLTSEWQSDTDRVRSDYIDLLKKVRKLVSKYDQEFKIGVAIPHFYSEIDKGKFEEKTLELVDYAAVMAYYDDPSKIIEKSAPHFVIADKLGKKISIGVETQDLIALNQGERRQTFFEEGWEEMEDSLAQVSKKFKSHPSFEGFAIHCYYSYKLLQKGRNVPIKQRPKDIYSIVSKRRLSNIKIDGNLSDWDLSSVYAVDRKVNVVHGQFSWAGPNDLSAKIYSMWDDGNLYFTFDITDDVLVQEKTKHDLWEGDHIEMWLDMNLMTDYNEAINSNDDYQLGFSPGNLKNLKSETYIWTPELSNIDYTKEIEIASAKTEKGYVVEVKLPARVLYASRDARQPVNLRRSVWFKNGDKFGISIDPSDCDDPAAPQKVLMSSSVERAWGDPTTFGILELK